MSRTCRIYLRKLKTCRRGQYALIVGGASSVQGIKGCYSQKRKALRARQHIREECFPSDMRCATIWIVRW